LDAGAVSAGIICLQGGRELTAPCDEMDRAVLERCNGTVVVIAGAARRGSDYAGASARAVTHYRRFGVEVDVVADPREDHAAALAALRDSVGLIVLPGGSPGGLLAALTAHPPGASSSIARRLIDLWSFGTGVSGASAGAMVLCAQTVTPDRSGGLADGLGLVPGVAIPHWSPGSERRWSLPDTVLWGLPECGGVLVDGDSVIGVGQGDASVFHGGTWHAVDRRHPETLPR
jgi:cyanophycinase-like exopeptidase